MPLAGFQGIVPLLPASAADWRKRAFDFAGAMVALVLLSPLLAVIAVVVPLDSRGPALFRQVRVGRFGREFVLYKFRTMTVKPGVESGSFDAGDVSRVTRVGAILRATKLDELPQLWNVLRGEMALVGPRPEVRKWVDAHPERWAIVQTVRPGVTDPASILFRHEEWILAAAANPEDAYRTQILTHKLELYEDYVKEITIFKDIVILWRTVLALSRSYNKDQ